MQQLMINHHSLLVRFCMLTLLMAVSFGPVYAEEIKTTIKDQKELSLTVYNQDLALIRDVRDIKLTKGLNRIAVREVSAQIRPETAIITSASHPNSLILLEQNFDYDLLTPQQLLQKYVGKQVRVIKTHPTTGAEKEEIATVLSANNGVVLKIGDRIETGAPGRIVYDQVPDNLRDRPTLSILANSNVGKKQTLELSYLSGGLSWKADYVAKLDKDDKFLDLNGWVTLNNQSGASYHDAKLQLVAGDVNRVYQPTTPQHRDVRMMKSMAADSVAEMAEESLFEYHLYTLGHKTDVLQNQTKQVALLSASRVPVKKEFMLRGNQHYYYNKYGVIADKLKVGVFVEFENEKKNDLGIALPKGIVRVYKDDSSGNSQFIGEDRIDHTPKDEKIRLKLGDAFDVTAKKKQTSYKKESAFGKYKHAASSSYEIEIHNAKEEDVVVKVLEPVPGDWKMVESSLEHEKVNAHTVQWLVKVPAEKRVTLEYKVLVRY
ncbi:MAG: DUF4139 domain-containing protein [Gammaproteobacteria bacterium]